MVVWVLVLFVAVAVLLALDRFPVDIVALGVVVALLVTGVLTPTQALAGFSSDVVVALAGLFVLTGALKRSGAIDFVGSAIERLATARPALALPALLLAVMLVSMVMNNTTCTALFLPIALGLATRFGWPTSRVLMPMAYASILGGTLTVIGTSTNLIVDGILRDRLGTGLGMFELAPVAAPIAAIGLVYLVVTSRRLPDRSGGSIAQRYPLHEFLVELEVDSGSSLVDTRVEAFDPARFGPLSLVSLLRAGEAIEPHADLRWMAGDRLLISGAGPALAALTRSLPAGLVVRTVDQSLLARDGVQLTEAVVMPSSPALGRIPTDPTLARQLGASIVSLHRHGRASQRLAETTLRVGDVVLLLGQRGLDRELVGGLGLHVLEEHPVSSSRRGAALAAGVFAVTLALAASGTLALPSAVLLGCLVALGLGLIRPEQAYAAIEWRLLVLIGGVLALATALDHTGAAAVLAKSVASAADGFGPRVVLAGFYLLTLLLTQPMSNQAAALLVLPLALEAAPLAGVDPRAMAATVAIAASMSFLTPFEPSCLLVYGPGHYRFADFVRLGSGLTLIATILTLVLVPWMWP